MRIGQAVKTALPCLVLVLCACTDRGTKSQPVVTSQSTAVPVGVPADQSLTSDEYVRKGLPAHDRTWSGSDMTRVSKVFVEIAQEDQGKLPRYRSERSGMVFDRVTSDENLQLYRSKSLPVEARLTEGLNYVQSLNQVLKTYISAFLKKKVSDSEVIELMGASLRSAVMMVELADEFFPTLNKNDPSYQTRLDGLAQMKRGLATVVAGSIQTLTEGEAHRTSERLRLIGYLKQTAPTLISALPPGSRLETQVRLEKLSTDPGLSDLQPSFNELVAVVREAVEKAGKK